MASSTTVTPGTIVCNVYTVSAALAGNDLGSLQAAVQDISGQAGARGVAAGDVTVIARIDLAGALVALTGTFKSTS